MWDTNVISWGSHTASGNRSGSLAGFSVAESHLLSAEGEFGLHFPFQTLVRKGAEPFGKCGSSAEQ